MAGDTPTCIHHASATRASLTNLPIYPRLGVIPRPSKVVNGQDGKVLLYVVEAGEELWTISVDKDYPRPGCLRIAIHHYEAVGVKNCPGKAHCRLCDYPLGEHGVILVPVQRLGEAPRIAAEVARDFLHYGVDIDVRLPIPVYEDRLAELRASVGFLSLTKNMCTRG